MMGFLVRYKFHDPRTKNCVWVSVLPLLSVCLEWIVEPLCTSLKLSWVKKGLICSMYLMWWLDESLWLGKYTILIILLWISYSNDDLKSQSFCFIFPLFSSQQAQAMDWDFVSRSHYWEQWHSHLGPTTGSPGQRCTRSFCRWDDGLAWLGMARFSCCHHAVHLIGQPVISKLYASSDFWCGFCISLWFFSLVSPLAQDVYFFFWEMVYCRISPWSLKCCASKFCRELSL